MTGEHTEVIDQNRVVIAVFRATEVPQYDINPWGLKIIKDAYEVEVWDDETHGQYNTKEI